MEQTQTSTFVNTMPSPNGRVKIRFGPKEQTSRTLKTACPQGDFFNCETSVPLARFSDPWKGNIIFWQELTSGLVYQTPVPKPITKPSKVLLRSPIRYQPTARTLKLNIDDEEIEEFPSLSADYLIHRGFNNTIVSKIKTNGILFSITVLRSGENTVELMSGLSGKVFRDYDTSRFETLSIGELFDLAGSLNRDRLTLRGRYMGRLQEIDKLYLADRQRLDDEYSLASQAYEVRLTQIDKDYEESLRAWEETNGFTEDCRQRFNNLALPLIAET